MKRIILSIILVTISVVSMAQAKKPTIMIIPSDAYCSRHGYTTEWVDENGNRNVVSDIDNIFKQDNIEDLRLVISELSQIMAERVTATRIPTSSSRSTWTASRRSPQSTDTT